MSAYSYHPPKLHKGGRVIHGMDGVTRRRCRICGHTVYGRNGGICRDCLSKRLDGNETEKRRVIHGADVAKRGAV